MQFLKDSNLLQKVVNDWCFRGFKSFFRSFGVKSRRGLGKKVCLSARWSVESSFKNLGCRYDRSRCFCCQEKLSSAEKLEVTLTRHLRCTVIAAASSTLLMFQKLKNDFSETNDHANLKRTSASQLPNENSVSISMVVSRVRCIAICFPSVSTRRADFLLGRRITKPSKYFFFLAFVNL